MQGVHSISHLYRLGIGTGFFKLWLWKAAMMAKIMHRIAAVCKTACSTLRCGLHSPAQHSALQTMMEPKDYRRSNDKTRG